MPPTYPEVLSGSRKEPKQTRTYREGLPSERRVTQELYAGVKRVHVDVDYVLR